MADLVSPSNVPVLTALSLLFLTAGYYLGKGSLGSSRNPLHSSGKAKSWPNSYDVTIHPDSSDEDLVAHQRAKSGGARPEDSESDEDGDEIELNEFADNGEEVKLVLAVRTDLGMGKGTDQLAIIDDRPCVINADFMPSDVGKIAAQCSHATLACYKYLLDHAPSTALLQRWERGGQPKIAVQVKSEDELTVLQAQAISLGLCARVIHDAGRTQIAAGSATVLGVLGPKGVVDQVTGQLKLL